MKKAILASALTLLAASSALADAKYVFYFIGDGMGMGHVNTTETYRRDILKTDSPLLMLTFPIAGQVGLTPPTPRLPTRQPPEQPSRQDIRPTIIR